MGTVTYLSQYKEEKFGLARMIATLFADLDRLETTICSLFPYGQVDHEYTQKYRELRALLQLECSMAISAGLKDPIMERARSFYEALPDVR